MKYKGFYVQILHDCFQTHKSLLTFAKTWQSNTQAKNKHLIENARKAYEKVSVSMKFVPMRGGTDGAQLSFRGFAAPNLSACYYNAHGVREFVPVPELEKMVDMLEALIGLYAQPCA